MKLTTRYLLSRCIAYVTMLLVIFSILYLVISLITSGDISNKNFNFFSAIYYLSLSIPSIIYSIAPVSVLVGVELALISLVSSSEYVILRVNGISLFKIMKLLFIIGSVFALATFLIGEFLVPISNNAAEIYKMRKTNSKANYIYNLSSGIWIHDKESDFINIRNLDLDKNTLYNLSIYSYSQNMQLVEYTVAKSALYDTLEHQWILHDVMVKSYATKLDQDAHYESSLVKPWHTSLSPQYFRIFVKSPENMSVIDLSNYLNLTEINPLAKQQYQVLFWRKIFYPFYCIILALIAIIFIPNNRRSANLGNKILLGVMTGIGVYFVIQLISRMAILFELNAFALQLFPVIGLFLLCALVLKFKK